MEIGKTSHMGLINPIDKCKIVFRIWNNKVEVHCYNDFIFPNRVKIFSDCNIMMKIDYICFILYLSL